MSVGPQLPPSRTGKEALVVAANAAEAAASVLKGYFHSHQNVESKGKRNLVSQADLLAESTVVDILKEEYPDHSILSEESYRDHVGRGFTWIIDPLDGTTNFVFGIPVFCVSIALAYENDLMVGIVHDPLRNEMFWAEKGSGAFLNGAPMSVARDRNLDTVVIGLDLGYEDERTRQMLSRINELWSAEIAFRLMGSAALGMAYVACGRMDIYTHRRVYPWDIAGALLLISEAGGEVTDSEGMTACIWSETIIACGDSKKQAAAIAALRRPYA